MPRYTVNATLTVPAWADVDAEDAGEAAGTVAAYDVGMFEYDMAAATIAFDITPMTEPA